MGKGGGRGNVCSEFRRFERTSGEGRSHFKNEDEKRES